MKRYLIIPQIASLLLCALCSCSLSPTAVSGTSSGTGNNSAVACAFAGHIQGTIKPLGKALLYSSDWNPINPRADSSLFADSAIADSNGKFAFSSVPPGIYNLIIFSWGDTTAGIFKGFPCKSDTTWADTIDTLKEPGYLHGFLTNTKNDTLAFSYIYVKGTPFHAMTDPYGEFLMGALPPSRYTMQVVDRFSLLFGDSLAVKWTSYPLDSSTVDSSTVIRIPADSVAVSIYPGRMMQLPQAVASGG
ncbi:MAG: hypothetical protein PHC61_00465 [Chitinivibrionales bacterium]|nr:hypothetical protein [Chitinivibrionales bacterium]